MAAAGKPTTFASPDLLWRIRRSGWALTKAAWVRAMFGTDWPTVTFPLDAEVLAEIPVDVPGQVPVNVTDLLKVESAATDRRSPKRPQIGLFQPTAAQKRTLGTFTPQAPYRRRRP